MGYGAWGLNELDPTVTEHSHTSVISLEWEKVSCPSPSSTHLCLVGTAWAGDSFLRRLCEIRGPPAQPAAASPGHSQDKDGGPASRSPTQLS